MIDLYEQDYPTLLRHCPQLLPPDSLRGMCKQGRHGLMPLKGYDKPTEGSEWIVHCARKPDTRPLWILVWGTLEDVAQALHDAPTYPPERKIGQGFASATGQYLDICIRFDTETLTGYALRIIRTTKYANAVDMQLMRYDHGNTTMIGEPISTTCFISPCTIHVWTKGNQLRAHVETAGKQRKSELADHVDLQTTIQQEPYYGAAFQFTGSAGGSAQKSTEGNAELERIGNVRHGDEPPFGDVYADI